MKTIRVSLKERSYDIIIGKGAIKSCPSIIKSLDIGRDAVIITNKALRSLHADRLKRDLTKFGFEATFELVPDSERAKSFKIAQDIIERISSYDKNKSIFIIAFGGGVIGDLAGFIAAIYKRGIPYVQIPTTLLAQVDSAIGGKTAIDLPRAKNLAGAFYQPRAVVSDTNFLRTLSIRQLRNGAAEIIKYGVICDPRLFCYVEANYKRIMALEDEALEFVITRSSQIKARLVSLDERDNIGKRVILNYGHTIGHAIETASGYSKGYSHGEAVAAGMVIAAAIAVRIGILKMADMIRIKSLLKKCGLAASLHGLSAAKIYNAHLYDKKFINRKNRFVLPVKVGAVRVVEGVDESVIKSAIREDMEA